MPEVASFVQPLDQFQPDKSAYECVAFGCADIYYSGPPGAQPAGNAGQIISLAEAWYARLTGSNDANNAAGLSSGQEYMMLASLGLKYQALSGDLLAGTRAALASGLPVLICGAEASFYDVQLGRVPYAWSPAGNHCIVASGLAGSNLFVRDYANSEFFGFCRQYSAANMRLVSATVVHPRWKEESMIPPGWRDNGTELVAPNNNPVRSGFRTKILEGWEASDQPLAAEAPDPMMPGGTIQHFSRTVLTWNPHDGIKVLAPASISTTVASMQAALRQVADIATKAANPS